MNLLKIFKKKEDYVFYFEIYTFGEIAKVYYVFIHRKIIVFSCLVRKKTNLKIANESTQHPNY